MPGTVRWGSGPEVKPGEEFWTTLLLSTFLTCFEFVSIVTFWDQTFQGDGALACLCSHVVQILGEKSLGSTFGDE